MDRTLAARCLAELGNVTRLDIFRLLVRAAPHGLRIGDIQGRLDIPASTLAFHLRGLVAVGLVVQERSGRDVVCRAKRPPLDQVVEFLVAECCKGFADEPMRAPARKSG